MFGRRRWRRPWLLFWSMKGQDLFLPLSFPWLTTKGKSRARRRLHTLAVHLHHGVYRRGLDVVQDVIACSGYEGAVTANLYVVLYCDKELQYMPPSSTGRSMFSYISCKFFL